MRVLIVDDDLRMLDMLEKALKMEKFDVERAYDGEMAIQIARQKKFNLIVLDVEMPRKSGFEVIAALRSLGDSTPILVVSAHGLIEDRVRGLDLGADDYLVKGFSLSEFLSRVRALLRRQTPNRRNFFNAGELYLNLATMKTTFHKQEVNLSKKEFALLFALLKKKDKVVSRKELIENAWGKDGALVSNSLDVHICALRQKLEGAHSSGERLIQTVRGSGFKIVSLAE